MLLMIENDKKPPLKTDSDLVSSMASRLKTLEMTCHSLREELKEKVLKISNLI